MMIQVQINISDIKKWHALKPILESMGIDYVTHNSNTTDTLSEIELELLARAQQDVKEGRLSNYISNRDILAR